MEELILENRTQLDMDALMERYRAPMIGLLVSWGTRWNEAQELAEDVFVQAYLSQKNLRADPEDLNAVGAWLRGIARNLRLAHYEKQLRRNTQKELSEEIVEPCPEPINDKQTLVLQTIQKLKPEHREVICMFYLEENKVKEIASLLEVSESTVAGRLYQARKELKRVFTNLQKQSQDSESQS